MVSGLGQMIHLFLNQNETLDVCILNQKQKEWLATTCFMLLQVFLRTEQLFFKEVHLASFHFDIKENLLFKAGETAQQVKALVCSYRRPGFSSQHPHGESQPPGTRVPENSVPSLGL